MKKYWKVLTLFLTMCAMLILSPALVHADNGFVKDGAHVLSQTTQDKILNINKDTLQSFKEQPQLVVMTVKSLNGKTVKQAADAQFNKYHFGNPKYNNGLLIYVAIDDHKVRVATGTGLDSKMPDGDVNDIVTDDVKSQMKDDDYDAGILQMAENATMKLRQLYDPNYSAYLKAQQAKVAAAERREQKIESKRFIYLVLFTVISVIAAIIVAIAISIFRKVHVERALKKRYDDLLNTFGDKFKKLWRCDEAKMKERMSAYWDRDTIAFSRPTDENVLKWANLYAYADLAHMSYNDALDQVLTMQKVAVTAHKSDPNNQRSIDDDVLSSENFDPILFKKNVEFWSDIKRSMDKDFDKTLRRITPKEAVVWLKKEKGLTVTEDKIASQLQNLRNDSSSLRAHMYDHDSSYAFGDSFLFNYLIFSELFSYNQPEPSYLSSSQSSSSGYDSHNDDFGGYDDSSFGGGGGGFDGGGGTAGW